MLIVVLLSTKLELSQKGFRQVQGVDYDESFSLVSMLKSVRIMLAIATFGFMQTFGKACIYKKVSGSTTTFLIIICE